jgi:hypothetical protein
VWLYDGPAKPQHPENEVEVSEQSADTSRVDLPYPSPLERVKLGHKRHGDVTITPNQANIKSEPLWEYKRNKRHSCAWGGLFGRLRIEGETARKREGEIEGRFRLTFLIVFLGSNVLLFALFVISSSISRALTML